MRRYLGKGAVAVAMTAGSLGIFAGVAVSSAGAAARVPAVVAKTSTWTGTVDTVDSKKDTFTMTVAKKYRVDYSSSTKWTKGSATDLKKGAKATVTGTLSKVTIKATSISI